MIKKTTLLFLFAAIIWIGALACNESNNTDSIDGDSDLDITDTTSEQNTEDDNSELAQDGDETELEEAWELPYVPSDQWGSYNVGAKIVRFVDEEQQRDIPGIIWYPTNDTEGEKIIYQQIFRSENAIENAKIAEDGPFPVIVFSHGSTSFAEQSFYQTEFFASHGFIVVACNHIGNTAGTNDDSIMVYMMQQRPRDLSIMIDHLEVANANNNDPFFSKVDLDKIGAIGHSFGGFTVTYIGGAILQWDKLLELCGYETKELKPFLCTKLNDDNIDQFEPDAILKDERVKAIIPQAPVAYSAFWDEGLREIDVPVMIQIGELDETLDPYLEMYPAYDAMNAPKYLQVFNTGGHYTFSAMCQFAPTLGDGCGEDFISKERAYYLINLYSLAFMRYYLWDEERDANILSDDYAAAIEEITLKASR